MRCSARILVLSILGMLCACGGGGSPIAPTIPPSNPIAADQSTATRSVELGLQPTTAAIPVVAQITGTIAFPAVAAPTTIVVTASESAPAGVALDRLRRTQSGALTVFEYITFVPQNSVTLPAFPSLLFTYPASTQIAGKSVYYGISDIDAHGALVSFETQGPGTISGQSVTFPVVATALSLVGGHRYTFVVYGTGTIGKQGIFTEYLVPTANSGPTSITAGSDGALWFVESNAVKIGRISTAGSFAEYPIARSSGLSDITAGPDGAVWFTESKASAIGRITTAGIVSKYAVRPGSGPVSLTTGPDGALWFTENTDLSGGSKIGRITTSGNLTEFPIPHPGNGITTGADGALWIAGGLQRMTTSGSVSSYNADVPDDHIAAGPDGALWFSMAYGGETIGRSTTGGRVTFFGSAVFGAFGRAITAGPDGAMWFTEAGDLSGPADKIGRITMSGNITEYEIPTKGGMPAGIAVGSDGALWFTENVSDKIGRLAPP